MHFEENGAHRLLQKVRSRRGDDDRGDAKRRRFMDNPGLRGIRRVGGNHIIIDDGVDRCAVYPFFGNHFHRFVMAVTVEEGSEELFGCLIAPGQQVNGIKTATVGFRIDKNERFVLQVFKRIDRAVPMDDDVGMIYRLAGHLWDDQHLAAELLVVQHVRERADEGDVDLALFEHEIDFIICGPMDHLAADAEFFTEIIDDLLIIANR